LWCGKRTDNKKGNKRQARNVLTNSGLALL
jgi:hypothetical protein